MGALLLVGPPVGRGALDLGAPLVAAARFQARQQRAQGERRIADQRRLHRVAQRQHRRVDVDLHAARGAFLGQELAIGEGGTHHQQRVAALHQYVGGLGAQKADLPRDEGQAVGQHALPSNALATPACRRSATATTSAAAFAAPAPISIATRSPRFRMSAARSRSCSLGTILGRLAHAGMDGAVGMPRLDRLRLLHVVRKDHQGHAALGLCDAHRSVDEMPSLFWRRTDLDELRDVLHQRSKVDLLLVVAAQRGAPAGPRSPPPAGGRAWRRTIRSANGWRPARRSPQAHADLTGEAGMAAGHEGCFLLVPNLHEVERILHAAQRRQQAVDAVARIAEQAVHAPLAEPLEDEIADGLWPWQIS